MDYNILGSILGFPYLGKLPYILNRAWDLGYLGPKGVPI